MPSVETRNNSVTSPMLLSETKMLSSMVSNHGVEHHQEFEDQIHPQYFVRIEARFSFHNIHIDNCSAGRCLVSVLLTLRIQHAHLLLQ